MEEHVKQAKLKALSLLTDMDRTETQLRQKLKRKAFDEEAIEQAVAYVKSYGYVDDEKYVQRFIESRKKNKSKQEITALLSQKGISRELIAQGIEMCYCSEDALEAIRHLVSKKQYDPESCSDKEKKKMYEYLIRKGFYYEDIRQVIQVSFWNA